MLAMLVCLHFAATRGVEDFWARGLMMAHLGLFLVWQPFIQAGQRLKVSEVILIVLIAVGILAFLNWWMLGLWVVVLAGIVGGQGVPVPGAVAPRLLPHRLLLPRRAPPPLDRAERVPEHPARRG